jgi:Zn-dependent protease
VSGDLIDIAARVVFTLVPMILSLTVHEFAHAWSAKRLGDDTAERLGRLTLNPVAHVDPIGTLLLPIILLVWAGGFMFGWAKPVPVNPVRFTRKLSMRTGMLLVSAAGPISNIVLAVSSTAILAASLHVESLAAPAVVTDLLARMITINIALALFNLIPVSPLDGQKVLLGLLSGDAATAYERFSYQYGSWLLMGVMIFGGRIIAGPFQFVLQGLLGLFGLAA